MEITVKAKAIKLINFNEELLPSGRKLLHVIFKDKYNDYVYRWIPPWRNRGDESGVEKLFFKAIEVEEWNDYEGAWSDELRQAAKKIPSIEEIELPVKIKVEELSEDEDREETYRVTVNILSEKSNVSVENEEDKVFLSIGNVKLSWEFLKQAILNNKIVKSISKNPIELSNRDLFFPHVIRFYIWISKEEEKIQLAIAANDIAYRLRSFIRKRLSDCRTIEEGFEKLKV
jgi:hypothetical protein